MATKKKPIRDNGSTVVIENRASRADVIRSILSKIREIDAVFVVTDDANVVHVFSVVKEFQSNIYDKLLKRERAIEKHLPHLAFEFHVRAHQGWPPAQAAPIEAELVYAR